MNQLSIVTTREELRELLKDILKELLPQRDNTNRARDEPDIVDTQNLVAYRSDIGIETTRNKIRQLALKRKIPYMEFDGKLLFSKKEFLATITANKVLPRTEKEILKGMVHRMKRQNDDDFF